LPRPSVVWFKDTHLLDSYMESQSGTLWNSIAAPPPLLSPNITFINTNNNNNMKNDNNAILPEAPLTTTITAPSGSLSIASGKSEAKTVEPYNTVTLGPLTRNDLKLLLTCEASNNNLTLPTSLVVMVDMNLPPLSVVIRAPDLPLTAGREYQVVCETSSDGNLTSSSLSFLPRPGDDGSSLRCQAETRAANQATLHDHLSLTVHYLPTAAANFGSSLDEDNIKEGDDVYFECAITANPRVSHVSWRHNNAVLEHNITGGVIVSNQSLVLQGVTRGQAGRYSCHAHNPVGDGASNTLRLDVKSNPCNPLAPSPPPKSRNSRLTLNLTTTPSSNPHPPEPPVS
ncbi:hypothetical protein Pmani_026617, partial [Petrolisthes manimaculis]